LLKDLLLLEPQPDDDDVDVAAVVEDAESFGESQLRLAIASALRRAFSSRSLLKV
jgi:hypothetical protein